MIKVLFVLQSIGFGGSMTSLINLLGFLKENSKFSVEVLFMDRYGELLEQAENVANILPENKILHSVSAPREKLKRLKRYDLLVERGALWILGKMKNQTTENIAFEIAAKVYSNKYDCIVAYQESISTKFVSRISASKKIAWIHNDFNNVLKLYRDKDELIKEYSLFDSIVCVSKAGQKNFQRELNFEPGRIEYVYNTLNDHQIKSKSVVPLEQVLKKSENLIYKLKQNDSIKFVSSGRMVEQKRFDRAIYAAKLLKLAGLKFYWFIIGDGPLLEKLSDMVINEELEGEVFFTGSLKNPFPIVRACNVFVLTSDFEAHPMVANEALILGKPVISTNFESAGEVVVHGKNGFICEMNPNSVANYCKKILENKDLYFNLVQEANKFRYQNNKIVEKVENLIGEYEII